MKIVLLYEDVSKEAAQGDDVAIMAYGPFINYQIAHQWYDANKSKLKAHDQFDIIDYAQIVS